MTDRTYRVIVEGELSDDLAGAFPGMVLTRAEGSTALTGTVRDQAELQSLLRRVSDLGLTLLEASAIDDLDRRPGASSTNAERRFTAAPYGSPGDGFHGTTGGLS